MSSKTHLTYPTVCFSKTDLSKTTIFEITSSSVYIYDSRNNYKYIFPGGSAEYSIIITDSGTQHHPYKNITIKRFMPICPISGSPVIEFNMARTIGFDIYKKSPDRGIEFKQGYAFNCYQVKININKNLRLNPVFYYKIGIDKKTNSDIYLVVPIIDKRKFQPAQIDALYTHIGNMDVVKIIADYYNQLSEKDLKFNFHMEDTPVKLNTFYHKRAIIDLFLNGKLKLGITNHNWELKYNYFHMSNIFIIEQNAYYDMTRNKINVLTQMFRSCNEMITFRETLINKILN